MGAHLITGHAGTEHVTAADQGAYNAGVVGKEKYVLQTGNMFAAEIVSNNLIKIRDGDLVNQGRHINIPANDYEECTIDNGLQSVKRNDLIVMRYIKDQAGIESSDVIVIKGVSGDTAADPDYITGDILAGDTTDDFPLYRVCLDGLNITAVEPLFPVIMPIKNIMDMLGTKNIKDIGDGTVTGALSALNTDLDKRTIIMRTQVRDNLSVAAESWDYFVFNKFPRMEGYTRCAITASVNNATQNGAGSSLIIVNSCVANENEVQVNLRNMATGSARIKITVSVLYIKDKFITIERYE